MPLSPDLLLENRRKIRLNVLCKCIAGDSNVGP